MNHKNATTLDEMDDLPKTGKIVRSRGRELRKVRYAKKVEKVDRKTIRGA